jgi:ribose transport system ATP-binding protein
VPVLRDVEFQLGAGRILGLVGENGAGKSTLMNILGGVLPPDSGEMRLHGMPFRPRNPAEATRAGIAFVHQELNLFTNLSVAENMYISDFPRRACLPFIHRRRLRSAAAKALASIDLSISPATLVESLSPGERQLVEIAKGLSSDARIMIFDEPTTSLTERETKRLFAAIQQLKSNGISQIYISHILGDVMRLCDDVLVLRDGQVVGAGPRSDFTVERLVSLMVGRRIEQLFPKRTSRPSESLALDVRNVSQPGLVNNIDFRLHRGEVLGVAGLMGSGRTELARILFGLDPMERGEIRLNDREISARGPRERIRQGMAFLTENRREEGLMMDAAIAENVSLVSLPEFRAQLGLLHHRRVDRKVAEAADDVRLDARSLHSQPVKTLSGGNQQKVVLAKWLLGEPSVFVLDEPTRGIDIGAKHEVYRIINAMAAGGAGVLFISSEIEELTGMCDRILVMSYGEIVDQLDSAEFDRERILRSALREAIPR